MNESFNDPPSLTPFLLKQIPTCHASKWPRPGAYWLRCGPMLRESSSCSYRGSRGALNMMKGFVEYEPLVMTGQSWLIMVNNG